MNRTTMILAAAVLALSGCPAPVDDDDDDATVEELPDPTWSEGVDLFAPIQEHAVVVRGREVIVLGGFDDEPAIVDRVEAYDVDAGTWRALPSLPAALHHVNATTLPDGTIVVAGSNRTTSFVGDGRVWTLAPDATEWEERTPLPEGRERGSAAIGVLDGKVHLVGGLRPAVGDWHDVWDPETDTWEQLDPAPVGRDHGAHGVVNGRLIVAGGRGGNIQSIVPPVWIYDPGSDTWTQGADMPRARGGTAGAAWRGELVVIGGEGNPDAADGMFPDVDAYDPVADAWRPLPDMPLPVHGMGAGVVDDRVYVPGGAVVPSLGAVGVMQVLE